jgi:hypothetical protein
LFIRESSTYEPGKFLKLNLKPYIYPPWGEVIWYGILTSLNVRYPDVRNSVENLQKIEYFQRDIGIFYVAQGVFRLELCVTSDKLFGESYIYPTVRRISEGMLIFW